MPIYKKVVKVISFVLTAVVIATLYAWERFLHVDIDILLTLTGFALSVALLFFTLRTLGVRRLPVGIGFAVLLTLAIIGSIESVAYIQERGVRREYPEPCSFQDSPQIVRLKNFGLVVMQCRKDGTWGARID